VICNYFLTVTLQEALIPLSVVADILQLPCFLAVTTPLELTLATNLFELVNVIEHFISGTAFKVKVLSTISVFLEADNVMLVGVLMVTGTTNTVSLPKLSMA